MKTVALKKNNPKKEYAKRYLLKYIKELKVHFDLDDNEIKDILGSLYYSKSTLYKVLKGVYKYLR